MRNIKPIAKHALRARLRTQRYGGVLEALSPFSPVGWSSAAQTAGSPVETGFAGMARTAEHVPMQAESIFRVASISKLFGAAAAMRLVQEGRLTLDGDIAEVLGFSAGKVITLRQLITHTAGVDDKAVYDRVIGQNVLPPLSEVLPKSLFAYAPGTKFKYSNLGAGVVGMLVEKASGMPFDAYVRQCFFVPHGIDASFHPQYIMAKEGMANCYRVPGQTLAYDAIAIAALPLDDQPDPERHYSVPAGKLMISAPELLAAVQRLYQEDRALFADQSFQGSIRCDLAGRGLGPAYMPRGVLHPEHAYWGHQGVAYGALCEAWIESSGQHAAVLLTNGVKLSSIGPLYTAGQSGMAALLDRR